MRCLSFFLKVMESSYRTDAFTSPFKQKGLFVSPERRKPKKTKRVWKKAKSRACEVLFNNFFLACLLYLVLLSLPSPLSLCSLPIDGLSLILCASEHPTFLFRSLFSPDGRQLSLAFVQRRGPPSCPIDHQEAMSLPSMIRRVVQQSSSRAQRLTPPSHFCLLSRMSHQPLRQPTFSTKVPASPISPTKRLLSTASSEQSLAALQVPPSPQPRPAKRSHHSRSQATGYRKVLTLDTINPKVKEAKYAVRGELALRAEDLRKVALLPSFH